jgi:hypothetical protein
MLTDWIVIYPANSALLLPPSPIRLQPVGAISLPSAFHSDTVLSISMGVNCAWRKLLEQSATPNNMEEVAYCLDTRHRPRLLIAMMRFLAAEDSKISFEGRLSQTELARLDGVTDEETGVLKRATIQPKLDFLVLPLTQQKIAAIEKAIVYKIAFGQSGIIHVQIERNRKVAFAAYDSFHRETVVAYSAVPIALLQELTEAKVLRNYKRARLSGHQAVIVDIS